MWSLSFAPPRRDRQARTIARIAHNILVAICTSDIEVRRSQSALTGKQGQGRKTSTTEEEGVQTGATLLFILCICTGLVKLGLFSGVQPPGVHHVEANTYIQ